MAIQEYPSSADRTHLPRPDIVLSDLDCAIAAFDPSHFHGIDSQSGDTIDGFVLELPQPGRAPDDRGHSMRVMVEQSYATDGDDDPGRLVSALVTHQAVGPRGEVTSERVYEWSPPTFFQRRWRISGTSRTHDAIPQPDRPMKETESIASLYSLIDELRTRRPFGHPEAMTQAIPLLMDLRAVVAARPTLSFTRLEEKRFTRQTKVELSPRRVITMDEPITAEARQTGGLPIKVTVKDTRYTDPAHTQVKMQSILTWAHYPFHPEIVITEAFITTLDKDGAPEVTPITTVEALTMTVDTIIHDVMAKLA